MFMALIEGEERAYDRVELVIDFVEDKTSFEVDSVDLAQQLRHLNPGETIELRDDCKIKRL
jgi:hypothetical protein